MATTITKVRFVRCPKCRNLLTEFADVPVYQCGECGTVLRAKNGNAGENVTKGSIKTNLSSDNGSTSSGKQMIPCSSNVEHDCHEKGIEETGKSLKHSNRGSDSLRSNDKLEVFVDGHGDSLRSPTGRSSHAYDGSISSLDDGFNDCVRDKHRLLSRRTFRHQRVSASVDTKGKEIGEDVSRNHMSNSTDAGRELEARDLPLKSSLDSKDFHSLLNWMESEKGGPSRSLSAFHKDSTKLIQLEQDRAELLKKLDELRDQLSGLHDLREEEKQRSQFRGTGRQPPLFFNHDLQLLRHPTGEYRRPQQYQFSKMPLSCLNSHLEPNLYCNNGLCSAHAYNICCHSPQAKGLHQQISSSLPHLHKPRVIKRHCLPVSGGAPFVICYKCSELLQMPADFLVSRKRFHKLQCGACSEVLVLSFPARTRAIPQTLAEVGDAKGDPVSFTEEYGLSFSKSYSTEADPVMHALRNSFEEGDGKQALGPPLHRLMGYTSASELIYRISDDDNDDEWI